MESRGSKPIETLDVHLTAAEAFPAFERLFLSAQSEIKCGFRIFDLSTRLRSDKAQEIGETWFDLFDHTLGRGVDISLVLTDFDPIIATEYHRKSWESARQLAAVDAVSGRGRLEFRIARHPAQVGLVPRLLFRGRVRDKVLKRRADRNTPGLKNVAPEDLFTLSPATHHQKLAVFDRQILYIGGLDLDERRYDTPLHNRAAEETWHDVQVVVTGSVVDAAVRHMDSFEEATAGRIAPAARSHGFLRTLSAKRLVPLFQISPRSLVSEIEDAHMAAFSKARDLVYLETQFLRHLPLADAIAEAGRKTSDLRVIIVLPAAPEDVAFEDNDGQDARLGEALQAKAIERIQAAYGDRALICSPARPARAEQKDGRDTIHDSPIIYVHSKVSIFDDREAIVSSANLNGRSMRWDTEVGVHLTDIAQIEALRTRLYRHWFPALNSRQARNDLPTFDFWKSTIREDALRAPHLRQSRLLPYDLEAARSFGTAVPLAPDELV